MNDDDIPMRDSQELKKPATDEALARRIAQQRQLVNKWTRNELEDKYLVLLEESLTLKRHARKQEEKIRRMATKQLRLMSELKMKEQNKSKPTIRDTELEDQIEELKRTVQQQEQQNQQLRDRLLVAKQQLTSQGTRKTPYNQVQARIDTNMARPPPAEAKSMRMSGPVPMKSSARYGQSQLEDSRQENRQLHDDNMALRQRIASCEQEIMSLREQTGIRENEHTEEMIRLKQQLNADQRGVVDENIKMIRLTNELRDKSNKLGQLQAQYSSLEENTRQVKRTHDQVLSEMDNLHQQLKHEQNRCLMLQNELKAGSSSQRTILELQERAKDLERECELLRDANEQLVSKAFDLDRERDWRKKENALKVHIAQLEATLKADVGEKGSILDRLNAENDRFDKLTEEHKDLRVKYYQLKHEHDQVQDKLSFFSKESAVDMRELEEALVIVKKKKEKGDQELDFLHKVEEERHMDRDKENTMLKAQLADTVNELEKTRNLLIVQYKINNECRKEVEMSQRRLEEDKAENDTRLNEMAQMLDIRAARIKKLEAQMRDVAYGTKSVRIRPEEEQVDDDDQDETIALERGQNLFEIHIKKVSLSQEGIKQLGDEEPLIFCTWDFYEYETQSTAVLKGPRADFGFTSQYVVTVDDFFLHYLQKDSCTLELHQSLVTDFKTLAACQLKMRDILDKPAGRIHATGQLIGVENGVPGVSYGIVEYWVRLKVPMEQALRLYKERVKALGYVESNLRSDTQPQLTALDDTAARRAPDNINELTIDIVGCKGIKSRQRDVQPNVYCVYKFFDFNDYVTTTVESSNSPQFNDHKKYPVAMDVDLDKYLKTQTLEVYVFDDTDANLTNYLGVTRITLLPLSRDKDISGNFELFRKDGSANGVIEIHIKWAYSYLPTHTALVATDKSKKKSDTTLTSQASAKRPKDTVSSVEPERMQKQAKPPSPPRLEEKRSPETAMAVDKAPPPVKSAEPTKSHSSVKDREDGRNGRGMPVEEKRLDKPQPRPIDPLPSAKAEPKVQAKAQSPPGSRDKPPMSSVNDSADITEGTPVSGESDAITDDDEDDVVTPRDDEMDVTEEMQKHMAASVEEPSEDPGPSSSSSSVVMGSLSARDLRNSVSADDRITVTIFSLTLSDVAKHILNNDDVQKLFVEYSFLDVPSNELETPVTLPKLPANKPLSFNFNKVIPVDHEKNELRRRHLANWLLPQNINNAVITFTVVSEPVDDASDCEDIGFAHVNIVKDIFHKKRDMEEQRVPVYDVADESKIIGNLLLTVKCMQALNNIKEEMIEVD